MIKRRKLVHLERLQGSDGDRVQKFVEVELLYHTPDPSGYDSRGWGKCYALSAQAKTRRLSQGMQIDEWHGFTGVIAKLEEAARFSHRKFTALARSIPPDVIQNLTAETIKNWEAAVQCESDE